MHSKQKLAKEESSRREISFSDMHPELNKYKNKDEKKLFLKDIQSVKPNDSKGRKEREIYLRRNTPISYNLCHENVYFWTCDTLF